MTFLKSLLFITIMSTLLSVFTGCEEELLTRDTVYTQQTNADPSFEILSEKSGTFRERPGGMKIPEGDNSAPYPTIIEQEFIPSDRALNGSKCLTWKIIWPEYETGYDENLIPTVFATDKGTLNSINYLTSGNKHKTHFNFSLYLDEQLESTYNMGVLWPWPESIDAEGAYFRKISKSVHDIEYWVKEHPSLFEHNWDNAGSITAEVAYQEGDFFIYNIENERYGGIRIISMAPRIIEVYLAVPNEDFTPPAAGLTVLK